MTKVILPELGEGIEQATISFWFVQEGQRVNEKDDLVELTTDKATFNLPSPCSGVLTQIFFREGDTVNIGEVLAIIEEE
ncbi:MAG: biotin/lipoyl-binding protein [Candidatus Omnitrophica bacterium]|nr:biotin/lipoyl-binding protein [Candidatus Omnitrophota bacterium]